MKPYIQKLATAALIFATTLVPAAAHASAQGVHIVNTPHNLSTSGGGGAHDIKASDEERVCVFCHTPHHATSDGPLWSRKSNLSIYIPYASPTIKANPQQPMGDSRLCLSCHDGTVALGLLSGDYRVSTLGPLPPPDPDPKKNSNLGTDLSTSHPVSMTYGLSPEFWDKGTLAPKGINLAEGNYVECTSCHDPHNNQYGNFLVRDTSVQHDAICKDCHNKDGWNNPDSTHRSGGQRYAADVGSQVIVDGCRSCHLPHSAQRGVHLLKQATAIAGEESNCVSLCHKGASYSNPTSTDIASQMALPYSHPVQNYPGIHQANEVGNKLIPVVKHVQCVDCHNPHQSGWEGSPLGSATPDVAPASTAPAVNGPLRGVRGLDLNGDVIPGDGSARYEYEVCFRCHLGSNAAEFMTLSNQRPVRLFQSYDESLRFASGNPSYHPVTFDTIGLDRRNLLVQYQITQNRIYCSDCHAPHGSIQPHILRAENLDTFPSPASSYPLCFTCHDQQFLDPTHTPHSGSATLHQSHVRDHSAPCAACHDPHGAPVLRGANATNAAHLVNFDTRYTGITAQYNSVARSCTVNGTCHTTVAPTQIY